VKVLSLGDASIDQSEHLASISLEQGSSWLLHSKRIEERALEIAGATINAARNRCYCCLLGVRKMS
jgi:hypothetical protein